MSLTGSQLFNRVCAYCARTETSMEALADAAGVSRAFVRNCGARAYPRQKNADAVLAAMEANLGGLSRQKVACEAPVAESVPTIRRAQEALNEIAASSAAAEAATAGARRQLARAGGVAHPLDLLPNATAAERLSTAMVETVNDLIATVQRRWPEQWAQIVGAAREQGVLPGAMLGNVIERGLERRA